MATNLGGESLGDLVLGDGGESILFVDISDTITFSETYETHYALVAINDTLVFSDVWDFILDPLVSDTIVFSDTAFAEIAWFRTFSDTLTFNESLALTADTSHDLSDTLTFTDHPANTTLTDWSDTITFDDSADTTKVHFRSILDIVTFVTDPTVEFDISKRLLHTLTFVDHLSFVHDVPLTITESITFNDELVQEYIYRTITDTLTLVETLTKQFIPHRSPTDSLVLLENIHLQADYTRHPIDNLAFNDRCFAVVADRYMLFFGVVNSIALPPPEFNDNYAMQGKTIIKRVMSGSVRTYNKTTEFEKMHYDFIVTRSQANAFKDFLMTEFGNPITIYDWEGRRFQAKLLSDDIAIEEIGRWDPCGNKVRFSIEFLGKLYA